MVTLGIIAEYNPFHNGHYYHLTKSKQDLNADCVIVVLGSSFLQRGEPALVNKWERTKMALANGLDLVVELPLPYACSSAEYFAYGGVSLLESLGCDYISFGLEDDDLDGLKVIANALVDESTSLSKEIQAALALGLSYPAAINLAFERLEGNEAFNLSLLKNPNNILAIEYLKAMKKLNTKMKPYALKRLNSHYHSLEIKDGFASASAIRNLLRNKNNYKDLKKLLPTSSHKILLDNLEKGLAPILPESLGPIILGKLRSLTTSDLSRYPDLETGLENRLIRLANKAGTWDELLSLLQTKRYTKARLQRILCYILLNLTEDFKKEINFHAGPSYIRPLGFNIKGQEYLKHVKNNSNLPLVTRLAPRRLKVPERKIHKTLEMERRAADILALLTPNPHERQGGSDFRQAPLIWE